MVFNDCWCISFTLSVAAAAGNPIADGMEPLHTVPVIANYLLRSLNLHLALLLPMLLILVPLLPTLSNTSSVQASEQHSSITESESVPKDYIISPATSNARLF